MVANEVYSKWTFADWFVYNLIILIKSCKIQFLHSGKDQDVIQRCYFWKTSLFAGTLWRAHVSYLTMSTEGCSDFFKILFRHWVNNKNVKNECVENMSF